MITRSSLSRALGSAVLSVTLAVASEQNPFLATWQLDEGKSNVAPGLRIRMEAKEAGLCYQSGGVEYCARFDGAACPVRGVSAKTTVALERLDHRTLRRTWRRADGRVSVSELQISDDGSLLTIRPVPAGQNASPRETTKATVYERISAPVRADAFVGEWERNPIRHLGNSRSTLTFTSSDERDLMLSADNVRYRAQSDETPAAVEGTPFADYVVVRRSGQDTLTEVWHKHDRIVLTVVRTVSRDGTTLTTYATAQSDSGDLLKSTYVYRKVHE